MDITSALEINQHKVYQSKDEIPPQFEVKGPIFQPHQQVIYIASGEHEGRTGWISNILYAPNIDHYYQRIRVNTGNYSFIESASKFWELAG